MKGDTRKLRTIDEGTVYDVPAKLTKLARQIRDGECGAVSSVVTIVRSKDRDGNMKTQGYWFGVDDAATVFMMLEKIKKDVIG